MTKIWLETDGKWSTVRPSGFADEADLHSQIVDSPEMLPLSGEPQLVATFREVGLGGGSADVLAFEDNGRPVVIEVKLSKNPEAKRAVVAQTLTYAAGLHGVTVEDLERSILARALSDDGHERLADAVEETTGGSGFDRDRFYRNLAEHLAKGSFRLVIVLDDAPAQLVRLMGYLETIATTKSMPTTDQIAVDLVAVSAYDIKGDKILVPQRIDPEHARPTAHSRPSRQGTGPEKTEGIEHFRKLNSQLQDARVAAHGHQLAEWTDALEIAGLCRLYTVESNDGRAQIRPQLLTGGKSFAHFWPDSEGIGAWLYMTVIERRAPDMVDAITELTGIQGKMGGARATPELLNALESAYREALTTRPSSAHVTQGSDRFREWIEAEVKDAEQAALLLKVVGWADDLASEGACRVESRKRGKGRMALTLRALDWKQLTVLDANPKTGKAQLWLEGPTIAEQALDTLPVLSQVTGRDMHGFKGHADAITDGLLAALADACREAAGR